jgi:hypothetical protein
MNTFPLIRAVVEAIVFLDTSGEEVVDPDSAVSQLELIATSLKELSVDERKDFLKSVRDMAENEERMTGRTPRIEAILSLGKNLGLE